MQRKVDPRIFQLLAIGCYAILAPMVSTFERPHYFTMILLIYGVLLDSLIGHFFYRKVKPPYTSIIVAFACSIIMDSPHLWIYMAAMTIALLSKAFFRLHEKHILNPANAGVVMVLLMFPGLVAGVPRVFNFDFKIFTLLFLIGFLVAWYARTLQMAIFWVVGFSVFSAGRSLIYQTPLTLSFLPALAPIFVLFTFHMITDPATSPKSTRQRLLFVLLVAGLDGILRGEFIPFSNFFALFFTSMAWAFASEARHWQRLSWRHPLTISIPVLAILVAYRNTRIDDLYQNATRSPQQTHNGETLPLFLEKQNELGIHFTSEEPSVDPQLDHQLRIQWVAPGVTIYDFNSDGWMDILLVNSNSTKSKNALYINQKGQGFVDEAEAWGLASIPEDLIPQSSVPFDYNRDGKVDLFLAGPGCSHFYENQGHSFIDKTEEVGLKHCGNSIIALPLDFNQDGWMDLFVARFFSKNIDLKNVKDLFYFGPDDFGNAHNGGFNTLYQNHQGTFKDASEIYSEKEGSWTWDIGLADIRNNGKPVLVIGNDFGDDFYVEIGPQGFREITDDIVRRDSRSSMNVSFGFWDGPYPDIILTNVYSASYVVRGNFIWQFSPDKKQLVDHQHSRQANLCGWPWGVAYGDFNLDGEQDMYMANGMITRYKFSEHNGKDENFFKAMTVGVVPPKSWAGGSLSVFQFIDDQKNFSGNQLDCIFIKDRKRQAYVNRPWGIDTWDGRAVAIIDYDNDGRLDLLVTTQGDGTKLLQANTPQTKTWIGLDLGLAPSLTMGSTIIVKQGEQTKYHWYQNGKSGFLAYSDPRIHLGLHRSDLPVDIEIRLASGEIKTVQNLMPGQYHRLFYSDKN
ncbi:MAG: VCBS repeat-containing protein [Bdellovibrionales bacterium]|nr:VCBS repeat-containing protein [Bdellovibrionales bacterium]